MECLELWVIVPKNNGSRFKCILWLVYPYDNTLKN